MTTRQQISTNNQWENQYGYARINKLGPAVFIGGTVACNPDGSPCEPNNPAAQTIRCYEIIENALKEIDLDRNSIMRSRIFVTDISNAHEIGLAHKAFFQDLNPCLTMIEVSRFIAPEYTVEIECDAYELGA